MKAILFGASGMIGQGVLRECLLDPTIERVLSVIRNSTGQKNAKLTELAHRDFFDFASVESELKGENSRSPESRNDIRLCFWGQHR
jgi:putative NADH-flavin reductase